MIFNDLGEQNEKSETFFLIRFLPNIHYFSLKSFIFPNTANKTLQKHMLLLVEKSVLKKGLGGREN